MILDKYYTDPFFNPINYRYPQTRKLSSSSNWHIGENDELILTFEIPGVKRKDVELSVVPEDRTIHISMPDKKLTRTISSQYDFHNVSATLEDGILEVVFPLLEKEVIEVQID